MAARRYIPGPRRFVHSDRFNGALMLPFKAAGKPAVPGGRWMIRKRVDGKWHAMSRGLARRYAETFNTQAEAFTYAEAVAKLHQKPPYSETWELITGTFKRKSPEYRVGLLRQFQKPEQEKER